MADATLEMILLFVVSFRFEWLPLTSLTCGECDLEEEELIVLADLGVLIVALLLEFACLLWGVLVKLLLLLIILLPLVLLLLLL